MGWLDDFLLATAEAESPRPFFYWSGLCALSAVVKRNVWVNRFYFKVYPNIYVMLVAQSGGRKGLPIMLAQNLVKVIDNTRIISGQNSIEGVISQLAQAYRSNNGLITDSCALLSSDEFSNLLLDNPQALTILTQLYDGNFHESWKKSLKNSGVETLKEINLTLLGGSNEALLNETVREKDIEGGFIGRTMVIYERKRALKNDLTEEPEHPYNPENLVTYLREVSKVKGEFRYSDDGKRVFRDWYKAWEPEEMEDKTGTLVRLDTHVLKIAMLLSLSRKLDLVLEKQDIEEAIEVCLDRVRKSSRVSKGKGKSEIADQTKIIIIALYDAPGKKLERQDILRRYWMDIDKFALDRIVESLETAGIIRTLRENGKFYYVMDEEVAARIMGRIKGEK